MAQRGVFATAPGAVSGAAEGAESLGTPADHQWRDRQGRGVAGRGRTTFRPVEPPSNVGYWGQTGKHLLGLSLTGFDPLQTNAVF